MQLDGLDGRVSVSACCIRTGPVVGVLDWRLFDRYRYSPPYVRTQNPKSKLKPNATSIRNLGLGYDHSSWRPDSQPASLQTASEPRRMRQRRQLVEDGKTINNRRREWECWRILGRKIGKDSGWVLGFWVLCDWASQTVRLND